MFCNNCGTRGHPFRECKQPVLSCGVLLVRHRQHPTESAKLPVPKEDIEVLMIRRKDSMAYTEFLRGKYDPSDTAYIQHLLSNVTKSELALLKTLSFEQLWTRLWNNPHERHHTEFTEAQAKFDSCKSVVASVDTTAYTEPEWGFPKGRRFRTESDITCAEREFIEETNFPRDSFVFVKDVVFKETFTGTNGVPYEHRYFLAIQHVPVQIHRKFTLMQKREISAIGWKTLSDCMALTRPHYSGREALLCELSAFVSTVEVDIRNLTAKDKDNGSA